MSRWERVTPGGYLLRLRQAWGKLLLASALAGAAALTGTSLAPGGYRATAVLRPVATGSESAEVAFESVMSPIGVAQGGSAALEELVVLFRSRDLTRRVFRRHDLWPSLWGDRLGPTQQMLQPTLWERLCWGQTAPRPPGDWDAVRAARAHLRVSADVRLGVVTVSFEASSREAAAAVSWRPTWRRRGTVSSRPHSAGRGRRRRSCRSSWPEPSTRRRASGFPGSTPRNWKRRCWREIGNSSGFA